MNSRHSQDTEGSSFSPRCPASTALGRRVNAGVDMHAHHLLHMLGGGVGPHNTGGRRVGAERQRECLGQGQSLVSWLASVTCDGCLSPNVLPTCLWVPWRPPCVGTPDSMTLAEVTEKGPGELWVGAWTYNIPNVGTLLSPRLSPLALKVLPQQVPGT